MFWVENIGAKKKTRSFANSSSKDSAPSRSTPAANSQAEPTKPSANKSNAKPSSPPKPAQHVEPVEPATDALTIDKIVKLYSTAYRPNLPHTRELISWRWSGFRIIFQAAKDYAPLLAGYEKWERIEKKLDELTAQVAQLQASKNVSKA